MRWSVPVILVMVAFLVQPVEASSPIHVIVFPTSQSVVAGENTAFSISVNSPLGWFVNLTASVPSQWIYSIKPQLVQHLERAFFLLMVDSQAKVGTYDIIVRGQTGTQSGETTVKVTVTARGKLTANIDPRILTVGVNTNISIAVSPAVACTITLRGTNLNSISRFEQGKGKVTVMPQKIEPVIIIIEAHGYLTYVEVLSVEAPKITSENKTMNGNASVTTVTSEMSTPPFMSYILMVGGATVGVVVIAVLVKVMMRRKERGKGDSETRNKKGRRPPPPPPSELTTGATCPTCGTLVDTRFCPKCGTRVRTW